MPFGPYINKNNFAGYIGMIIPLAIGLGLSGRESFVRPSGPRTFRQLIVSWGDAQVGRHITLLAMAAFMALALFISLSRGGMISFLVSMAVLSLLLKSKQARGGWPMPVAAFLSIVFMLVIWLSFEQVSGRFGTLLNVEEIDQVMMRPRVWKDALFIAADYPLLGTGLATFASIYPLYQSLDISGRFLFPENDYLQLLTETGLLGTILALAAVAVFTVHVLKRFAALRDERWTPIAAGGLASGSAIAVHGLVDFNFHIPANALHFALIMGLLVITVNLRGGEKSQRATLPFILFPLRGARLLWGFLGTILFVFCVFGINSTNEAADRIHFKDGKRKYEQMLSIRGSDPRRAAEQGRKAIIAFRSAIVSNPLKPTYHYYLGGTVHTLHVLSASIDELPIEALPGFEMNPVRRLVCRIDAENTKYKQNRS